MGLLGSVVMGYSQFWHFNLSVRSGIRDTLTKLVNLSNTEIGPKIRLWALQKTSKMKSSIVICHYLVVTIFYQCLTMLTIFSFLLVLSMFLLVCGASKHLIVYTVYYLLLTITLVCRCKKHHRTKNRTELSDTIKEKRCLQWNSLKTAKSTVVAISVKIPHLWFN